MIFNIEKNVPIFAPCKSSESLIAMRIKLFAALAGLFFVTLAVTSCLDSDNNTIEYSSDDTIRAFRLDTIYGVKYNFTIDQINRLIYNADSVPFSADTIINKILVDSISHGGWTITIEKNEKDTVFTYTTDSLDFSNTMIGAGGKPLKMKVHSYDGQYTREYSVEVRRHLQNPDTLVWSKQASSFSQGNANGLQKTIILNNQLITYISNQVAYTSTLPSGESWTAQSLSGLSEDIKMTSFLLYKDKVYCVAQSGKVFQSTDGFSWQEASISGNVVALIGAFPDYISGLITQNGKTMFATTNSSFDGWDTTNEEIPATFPTENISMTSLPTNTNSNVHKYILMGKATGKTPGKTTPWFSFDGKRWSSLATDSYYCPEMEIPTIIYYDEKLYAFGGDFNKFYASRDQGRIWKEVDKYVLFPDEFKGRKAYSTVVDPDNYIWMIWSKGTAQYTETDDEGDEITITTPYNDEVWKGRINRLGFLTK